MDNTFFDGIGILTVDVSCGVSPEKDTKIPTKLSELENDTNFINDPKYQHTDNNYTDEDKDTVQEFKNANKVIEEAKKATSNAIVATSNSIQATSVSVELSSNPMRIVDGTW